MERHRKLVIIAICGTVLLLLLITAVALIVVSRTRQRPTQVPSVPNFTAPTEVRTKGVDRKNVSISHDAKIDMSVAVSVVCGDDPATADRYETRNDALRSIARRRDLPRNDIALLMAYVGSTNDTLRAERTAALKNDVLNLLRSQNPVPGGLAELLIGMFRTGNHPPAVLDYCLQHLGAMQDDVVDVTLRDCIRAVLVEAAKRIRFPYAGTALYSIAEDRRGGSARTAELKRLSLALCDPSANVAARIAAIQLAGQRGWREALPILRKTLADSRRDAVVDMAAIGSIGLLGGMEDLPLLDSMRAKGSVRLRPAIDAAIRRIKERDGGT